MRQIEWRQIPRGLLMGGADVIPGVSGGTIALILGIYDRLVNAISRVDRTLLREVKRRDFRAAAVHLDLNFLVPLAFGIGLGVVSLASIMHELLEHHRQDTFAFFFGLILGSAVVVGRMIERWSAMVAGFVLLGTAFSFWLVATPVAKNPPDALWYTFCSGAVAICAMILPGISGAFILLLLGLYERISGIVKSLTQLQFDLRDIFTLAVFGCGCVVGLLSFTRLIRYLLTHHRAVTLASLCGVMLGSLRKLWPFKTDLTPEIEKVKHKLFRNELPASWSDAETLWSVGLFVIGLVGVLALQLVSERLRMRRAGKDQPAIP